MPVSKLTYELRGLLALEDTLLAVGGAVGEVEVGRVDVVLVGQAAVHRLAGHLLVPLPVRARDGDGGVQLPTHTHTHAHAHMHTHTHTHTHTPSTPEESRGDQDMDTDKQTQWNVL